MVGSVVLNAPTIFSTDAPTQKKVGGLIPQPRDALPNPTPAVVPPGRERCPQRSDYSPRVPQFQQSRRIEDNPPYQNPTRPPSLPPVGSIVLNAPTISPRTRQPKKKSADWSRGRGTPYLNAIAQRRRLPPPKPNMRPFLDPRHQPGPHGIVQNVFRLLRFRLVAPQPMVEKSVLPPRPERARCPPLPVADCFCHDPVGRKSQKRMHMVRHEQKNPRVPPALILIEPRRIKNPRSDRKERRLPAFRRANRNEKQEPRRIDRQGWRMRQNLPSDPFHAFPA
jgi:hypothetical protein